MASGLDTDTIGEKEYRRLGHYHDSTTTTTRFGSWNDAVKAGGLTISNEPGFSDEQLFENIVNLWSDTQGPDDMKCRWPIANLQSPFLGLLG